MYKARFQKRKDTWNKGNQNAAQSTEFAKSVYREISIYLSVYNVQSGSIDKLLIWQYNVNALP